jgi:hypothetical protein
MPETKIYSLGMATFGQKAFDLTALQQILHECFTVECILY